MLAATGRLEITAQAVSGALGLVLIIVSVGIFAWLLLGRGWSPTERKRSGAILVLFVASSVFWAAYEQAGSSLSLFAERSTNRVVLGFDFPASWFQFVPALFRDDSGADFRVAVDRVRQAGAVESGKVYAWALIFGGIAFAILIPPARAAIAGRAGFTVVVDGHLFFANGRRDVPESGGIERDDEAGARARGGNDDGLVFCFASASAIIWLGPRRRYMNRCRCRRCLVWWRAFHSPRRCCWCC